MPRGWIKLFNKLKADVDVVIDDGWAEINLTFDVGLDLALVKQPDYSFSTVDDIYEIIRNRFYEYSRPLPM